MLDLGSTVLAVCGVALAVGVLCMMGANDVANVLGTAYGAGALHVPVYSGPASLWARIKGAAPLILFAGVFEFAGALFAGASVTEHVSSQLVSGGSARQRAIGALGCLLASFSLVTGSTVAALPVSASHATASAVVASGAYQVWRQRFARVLSSSAAPGQPEAPMLVHWPAVWSMLTAWTMSPFVGFLSGYVLYFICGARCISEEVLGLPLLAGAIIGTLSIFVFTAGPPDLRFLLRDWMAPIAAATSSLAFAVAATVFLVKRRALLAPYVDTVVPPGQSRVPHSGQDAFSSEWQAESSSEEPAHSRAIGLRILMVFTAAALAFAHGGNGKYASSDIASNQ
jgi:phosphate/sulfate permease